MTPQERAAVQLLTEAHQRWEDMPPVQIVIGRSDAYTLVMACQGMMTHPAMPPRLTAAMEHIGRQFQEIICDSAELYALFEAGWNRDFDVTPEDHT